VAILCQQTRCEADTSRSKPLIPTDGVFFDTKDCSRPSDEGDTGDIITPNHYDYTAVATNTRTRFVIFRKELVFTPPGSITSKTGRASAGRPVSGVPFRQTAGPPHPVKIAEIPGFRAVRTSQSRILQGKTRSIAISCSVHVAFDLSVSHRCVLHLTYYLLVAMLFGHQRETRRPHIQQWARCHVEQSCRRMI